MNGLVFRYDDEENVLRSVGDPPNGIIGVAMPIGVATIIVDSSFEPRDDGVLRAKLEKEGISETSTPIDVDDAIAACADDHALMRLVSVAYTAAVGSTPYLLNRWAFADLRSVIDLYEETAIAARERLREAGS